MGSDLCTCLNDSTTPESEDLSRRNNKEKKDNRPKMVLDKNNTIDSIDPLSSQREKESKSTTLSSNYKKNSIVSLRNSNYKQNNKKEKKKIINLKNNINNKKINNNKTNTNNKINNKDKNIIAKKPSVKNMAKEGFVNENFKNFFHTSEGQEMTLNINEYPNKLCITLHKYLVSLITKREFKKNIKYYIEEGNQLYKNCIDDINDANPNLKKYELNSPIKYTPDGYLKYYSEEKDIEKMTFNNPKECFDNCTIINYSDNNSTHSLDNMLWKNFLKMV